MTKIFPRSMALFAFLCAFAVHAVSAQDDSPAMAKFKQDIKAAVLNGSITVEQVKQLQADSETLKAAKAEQVPGAPIDLLTPYRAVSNMKSTMAGVALKDREVLHQDLQAVLATKTQPQAAADPTSGKKLGRDIFQSNHVWYSHRSSGHAASIQPERTPGNQGGARAPTSTVAGVECVQVSD